MNVPNILSPVKEWEGILLQVSLLYSGLFLAGPAVPIALNFFYRGPNMYKMPINTLQDILFFGKNVNV